MCGRLVVPEAAGSGHRNHCPNCLSSLHVDEEPGDRASDCGGVMDPIGVWVRRGGEWAVIHRCRRCGKLSSNRTAADDNPMKLMSVALRPLAEPPFPLEHIQKLTDLMGGESTKLTIASKRKRQHGGVCLTCFCPGAPVVFTGAPDFLGEAAFCRDGRPRCAAPTNTAHVP